jgi:mitogen-activated protein kinase 1/3
LSHNFIIFSAFENNEDAKRILREIILMKKFDHENIINMIDIIPPHSGATEFEDIYIVQVISIFYLFIF